jgi:DNA-directed RNA polymerase sigma subunit (sigma70/sigma32)
LESRAAQETLLSAAEEVTLAKRVERGDLAAKKQMINANLRLVDRHRAIAASAVPSST